jgi:hypothetical protein
MDKNKRLLLLSLVGLVVIIFAGYTLFQSVPKGPEPQPLVANISIINSNASNINGVYVINGVVKNNNPYNISVVDLNGTGYSSNGTMVDTGAGFTTTSPIPAGGTGNFTISIYDPQKQIMTYVVQVVDASK